jgi:hypothetical protein
MIAQLRKYTKIIEFYTLKQVNFMVHVYVYTHIIYHILMKLLKSDIVIWSILTNALNNKI